MVQFPAVVVDVGDGADFTIFSFGTVNRPSTVARNEANEYAKKCLLSAQPPIPHEIYVVNSQEDFDAILEKRTEGLRRREEIQAKIWRLENELAQAKKELKQVKAEEHYAKIQRGLRRQVASRRLGEKTWEAKQ
jgi:precorrin-6B methylase 2